MTRLSRLLICVPALLALGCASIGESFGDQGPSEEVASDPDVQEPVADVPASPTGAPDEGPTFTDSGPQPVDEGPPAVDSHPAFDPGEVDPDGPWICEDDGFIDEGFGDSCDWTWECGSGDYTITCTASVQGDYNCQCRANGAIIQKFSSGELCNALATVNAANAYCKWKLPLP